MSNPTCAAAQGKQRPAGSTASLFVEEQKREGEVRLEPLNAFRGCQCLGNALIGGILCEGAGAETEKRARPRITVRMHGSMESGDGFTRAKTVDNRSRRIGTGDDFRQYTGDCAPPAE